jgi:hypothetical protein
MKILHIWDVCGIANTIAKFMDRTFGTSSRVISRKAFDPFGLNTYTKPLESGAKVFVLKAILEARKYDILHVQTLDKIIPYLNILYHKPVILSYYGSDIRDKWKPRQKLWSHADLILYSTQELLTSETPKQALWFPCPIDTELFYPRDSASPETAVTFEYNANDLATKYATEKGLALTIRKRSVRYQEMPDFLSKFEYYVDVKRSKDGELSKAMSKTGLEALACGCKAIRWDGQVMSELPEEHKAENTVRKLHEFYQILLRKS